ncbi:MAG: tRNA pseudouridine(38-40) synthase TruA, partial [Methylococcales bacterium]|nr:tRNA pseudouridine(38-40) synthase TruA [Methylococcales bacterium]
MKVALGVEYNGREFSGWQTQLGRPSVQESLEKAVSFVANDEVGVVCAGRTDAGVHAAEQVVHFETSSQREDHAWRMGSNCRLPASIRILWARRVPDEFHARSSAIARYYHYVILNRPTRS